MLATIYSGTLFGMAGKPVDVEVDVAHGGFPSFTIVGLPNKAVDESKDRVRTAIVNSSLDMPESRITVNLAPADLPKEGSSFDLPIAIGILTAAGVIPKTATHSVLIAGELSLEGAVRPIPGTISLAMMAKELGYTKLFVPYENAQEAALVESVDVYGVKSLTQLVLHFQEVACIEASVESSAYVAESNNTAHDFAYVRGQHQAKRALEVAAAGFHNIHLKGAPGAGKTMLSRAFTTILPQLEREELLEVMRIYSAAGYSTKHLQKTLMPPFRSPHHTTSRIGLIGGGSYPRPGEISLAHRGTLFLDEFPEFPRSVLEALRQPLEDGVVSISRAAASIEYPSQFLLIAASNPCPCGYFGHPKKPCTCLPGLIARYQKRLSGPILDRIDLHIDVPSVDEVDLLTETEEVSEKSIAIRERVIRARTKQRERLKPYGLFTNSQMSSSQVRDLCRLPTAASEILKTAIVRMHLSARATFKVIKVAQTIADLEGVSEISSSHIAESLQYRVQEG